MKQKLTMSIGIPAYNEQANIKNLLLSLLSQKADNFELKEIIVVSDGSSDRTVEEARSIRDPRIIITDDGLRKGQAARQNEILNLFQGEILVLLNADVLPKNDMYLHYMVEPFYADSKLGIVSNDGIPLPAKTSFEKIINFSVAMRHDITAAWNNGNNIYMCHGHNRAFSEKFARQFEFGPAVSEDAYSYLRSKEKGFHFFYQPKAEILYRSPQNLKDHLKQSVRFFQGNKMLKKYFLAEKVQIEFKIPFSLTMKYALKYFFKNPVLFMGYCYILVLSNIKALIPQENNAIWEPSTSSKNLQ